MQSRAHVFADVTATPEEKESFKRMGTCTNYYFIYFTLVQWKQEITLLYK